MWEFEHTVETGAPPEAIWGLWRDVSGWKKWDGGLRWARLDGPFRTGTRGMLKPSGLIGALHARLAPRFELAEVSPCRTFTISQWIPLGRVRTRHELAEALDGRRLVTHRMEISVPLAPLFVRAVGKAFADELPRAMNTLVDLAEKEDAEGARVGSGPEAAALGDPGRGAREERSGDTIENPVSGERLTFLATSRDTNGAYTRVRFTLPPRGAGTPPHLHTTFAEHFEVVSGRLNVAFGGDEPPTVLSPGESICVPPYTVHRFWNGTDEETVFDAEVRPSQGFEAFMRASFGLARDGRTGRGVPRNPLELGLLMQPADVFLPGLPVPVQKAAFGVFASAARYLGYETRFLRYADPGAREDGTGGEADRELHGRAYGTASRKAEERARGLVVIVGGVSLGIGLALAFAPRSSAAALGWGDRGNLARAVGVADLIIGPALLLGRGRAQWMLARALLNAALSVVYAWILATGTPRRDRALAGLLGMSTPTFTDYVLVRRLRSVRCRGAERGE